MKQALEVRALDLIDSWLRTGQIHPAQESISTRIQMAASTGEIGDSQRLAMISITPELVTVATKISLADQYAILRKADVDPSDLDIVEENLNRLFEAVTNSDDQSMVLVHKMLYDFVDKLRKDTQHSQGGEQKDYSLSNDVPNGGVKVDHKQAPSEMSEGSGGGNSHVN